MTTKEQERKALARIRKIVEELGEDSYIGTAFDGAWEIAEQNIENDFACSTNDYIAGFKTQENALHEKNKEISKLKKDAEEWKKAFENKQNVLDNVKAERDDAQDSAIKNWNMFREQEDKVAALELEVIKLKAKLFDMMYAG